MPFSALISSSRFGFGAGVFSGDEVISIASPENSIEFTVIDREKPAGVASLKLQSRYSSHVLYVGLCVTL